MIKNIYIDNLDDLMSIITEQEYRPDIERHRSLYIYRGMSNIKFDMTTSLKRNCKGHQGELEPAMLRYFAKYAAMDQPQVENNVWRQMVLGQHYGLPTRLLDWSHSPLVALHFAVSENNMDKMEAHDCVMWRMDMNELHELLPVSYQQILNDENTTVFSVDMLCRIAPTLDQYDADMKDQSMVIVEPPSMDLRIINQYSFFSIVPNGMDSIEKFLDERTENTAKIVISKDLRWRIRDLLDQLNMSERTVYPGLDGLSKWLARHYFVK